MTDPAFFEKARMFAKRSQTQNKRKYPTDIERETALPQKKILSDPEQRDHRGGAPKSGGLLPVDVLIVTALKIESDKIKSIVFDGNSIQEEQAGGLYFQTANLPIHGGEIRVASLCFSETGMVSSSIMTTRAILMLQPRLVILGGICASLDNDVAIGDLIIGEKYFNYDSVKIYESDKEYNYPFCTINWKLKNAISSMIDDPALATMVTKNWIVAIGRPKANPSFHLSDFASGSAVVANPIVGEEIKRIQRKASGLDMEAFGVAKASDYDDQVLFFTAKSASDFADHNKGDDYQEYCCSVSASFIKIALERLDSSFVSHSRVHP